MPDDEDFNINNDPWGISGEGAAASYSVESCGFAYTECKDVIPIGPVKDVPRGKKVSLAKETFAEDDIDYKAVASLVLGILALACNFHICAIIGLFVGFSSWNKKHNALSLSGIICCTISLAFMVVGFYVFSLILKNLSVYYNALLDLFNNLL